MHRISGRFTTMLRFRPRTSREEQRSEHGGVRFCPRLIATGLQSHPPDRQASILMIFATDGTPPLITNIM